jgi:hypothetical protein
MAVKQVFNTSAELDYPTVLPTLDLDFANTKTLDPRITFTRASGGTYVGADGLIKLAGVNEARFDHDVLTGESLGLLIEESRTNLIVWSENPESEFFQPEQVSFNSNVTIAPDGNQTADKFIIPNGALGGSIAQGTTILSGATMTGSIFVKYSDLDRVELVLLSNNNTTPYARATINPQNGSITTAVSTANGGTNASASVVSYPNGWYRFSVTVTYPAVTLGGIRITTTDSAGSLGDGIKGTFVWGAQLEQGSFPTSYIPTQASTRTRAADNASITGKNFSEWYRQDEGTIFVSAKSSAPIVDFIRRFVEINNFETGTRYLIGYSPNTTSRFFITSLDNIGFNLSIDNISSISNGRKVTFSYSNKDFIQSANGILSTQNSLLTPLILKVLHIGKDGSADPRSNLNGHISRLTYFPKRLPNSQLQALTS